MILSILSPTLPSPRVCISISSVSSKLSLVPVSSFSLPPPLAIVRWSSRSSICPCFFSSSLNANPVPELLNDDKKKNNNNNKSKKGKCTPHSRTFLDARTEQELLYGIRKEADAGRLPLNIAAGMEEVYRNYRNAVLQSGIPNAKEIILSNMAVALDRMCLDVEDPFVFSPYHKALREPFDYYNFGQNYIRPLIDFRNSYVGNISLFHEVEQKLQQGHNIILMSNHQTEADPAVIALLLEKTNPYIAENLIYVAGDRVVTDTLCKPFSMGRNLICVYSKKHMADVPELTEMKKKANIRSLKEMVMILRDGSQIVWIAPSGGRDRPDSLTGEWCPAPFDASSVDNMRRITEHSGAPGHIFPLALLCHDIMPPPPEVQKEIGERRMISFHGAGLSIAPEISFSEIAVACEDHEEVLYDSVTEQYNVLKSAIHGKQGLEASTSTVSLSQPWD
ncbi:glycerol-3-phosphate acyltransferase, chloroplastic isoform X2 [Ricinus communis]|uniref:glycerol-3-phosphate acyltransferase, chloroplastic isoform X2 n=1 Tax=Ricinus communis TaxID=3988 RepID=UPI00077268CE|nr:glycerol-3-phosphate acyltransferase, chloroplastic isoform X2 [Ricinus communis]|eukprot:XP_015574486.1 glycerol-3-phosphate acyltransferase, chloroplastic isoform X2 [Ricinus communis]